MKKLLKLLLFIGVIGYVFNNVDMNDIRAYASTEFDRILKVEYCNDFYKGRPTQLNYCLAGKEIKVRVK